MIKLLLRSLTDVFYPPLCGFCAHPLLDNEEVLCLHCLAALPRTQFHSLPENETVMRLAGRFRFVQASSFLYFSKDGITQHLLHQVKYGQQRQTAAYLSKLFAAELQKTDWFTSVDVIIPVPLHSSKQKTRGFNQSAVIARTLAEQSGKIFSENNLKRIRKTQTQTLKTRFERLKNLEQAFELMRKPELEHQHVLIVDDVLTTGATLESCALVLKDVPGIRISLATIAIAHQ